MFGINALSQPELIQNLTVPPCLATSLVTVPRQAEMLPVDKSFYHFCFVYPLVLVTHSLQKLKHKEEIKEKGKEAEELGYGAYFCDFLTWFFSHKSKRLQAVPPFQWSPSLEKNKISEKELMLRAVGGLWRWGARVKPIFGAPQSQSSLRRANINFFFQWYFWRARQTLPKRRDCPLSIKALVCSSVGLRFNLFVSERNTKANHLMCWR